MCGNCHARPARYRVEGLTHLAFLDGVCAYCCAQWLRDKGDIEGARKFEEVSA